MIAATELAIPASHFSPDANPLSGPLRLRFLLTVAVVMQV
jgi:hypothetical protein